MHTPLSQGGSFPANKVWEKTSRVRKLGFYLVCVGVCESIPLSLLQPLGVRPFLLMPRVGWAWDVVARYFRDVSDDLPVILVTEIPSVCWMLLMGALFIYGKRPLKTYLASEVFLATPTLLGAVSMLIFGGGHFDGRELGFYWFLVMTVFDFIPSWMAIQALREASTKKRLVAEP